MLGHWYIACRSSQLGRQPLARTILDEPLAVFRETSGRAAAVADRCPHRHLALSRGRVTDKGLRCAYHGWTWDAEGRCTDIPASCATAESYSRLKVAAKPVKEAQGFIWVWMGAGEPEREPLEFPRFNHDGWHHWVMERVFEGSGFNCVENFLDVPHTAHVHRGLFRGDESHEIEIEITSGEDWIQAEFVNEKRMDSIIGKLLVPADAKILHTDRFQLPYVTRVDYRMTDTRQYIVMSQCTPESSDRTRVFTYMAYRFSPFGPLVRLVFDPLSRLILDQDVKVIAQQTADIKRTGPPRFLYWETDAIARGIRDLLDGKSLAGRAPERKSLRA